MVQLQLLYEGEQLNKRVHDLEREVDRLLSDLGRDPTLVRPVADELRRLRDVRGF